MDDSPGQQPRNCDGVVASRGAEAQGFWPQAIGAARSGDYPIPSVLTDSCLERFRQQFQEEYRPVGPTETILVKELARHAAGIDRWEAGSGAVERQAVTRSESAMPPLGFPDERACEHYLADRRRRGLVPCPKCAATHGHVIVSRRCWECGDCEMQTGLREGTVMARSPIPLRVWFNAVRILLWRPTIGAAQLSEAVNLPRLATARAMMAKIRLATASDDVSSRLAGLDLHFASFQSDLSQVSKVL